MKRTLALALIIGFVCWNTNGVESHHHHHHEHSHDSSKKVDIEAHFATRLMDDLHHEAGKDENIVISPLSIQVALSAIHKGAAGETREELGKYLQIDDSKSGKEASVNTDALKQILPKKESDGFSYSDVSLAVGVFVQNGFPIRKEYIDDVQKDYLTKAENVDFSKKDATDKINKFVSDLTKGHISPLFTSPLDDSTQLVLLSTLYFHGVWKNDFPATNTKPEKFFTGTKNIEVHMMRDTQIVAYYHNHMLQYEAIQIPYFDENYVMGITLPHKEQSLMNLSHYMTGEELHESLFSAKPIAVDYKIPKMKFSWNKSLKSVLQQEGVKTIFEKPDFSQLTTLNVLKVTDVYHAAKIEVDEKGTVASAVTAGKFTTYSLKPTPQDPRQFYADRPFLLTILHKPTNLILFQAFVHQPFGASA